MRIFLAVVAIAVSLMLIKAYSEHARTERLDALIADTEKMISALKPDMVPPLSAKPIDDAAAAKAAEIDGGKYCLELGKALRGKDAEFTRAMIQRTAELGRGVLKFGQQAAIRNKQVHLGMTACMATAAWGKPNKVNRSVGSYGVHEQWVYPASYLYFEEDILTSYQN